MSCSLPTRGLHLSAYPALALFSGLSLGVWIAFSCEGGGSALWIGLAPAAIAGFLLLSRSVRGDLVSLVRLSRYLCAAALAVSAGGLRANQYQRVPPTDISRAAFLHPDDELTVYGHTLTTPVTKNGRGRFVMRVDSIAHQPIPGLKHVTGRLYVSVRDAGSARWLDGSRAGSPVRVVGRLQDLRPPRNPADFDFGRYLRQRSILGILRVSDEGAVRSLGPPPSPIRRVAAGVERRVEHALFRFVPTETARDVLFALILGRRGEIDDETLDHFARTGLMHVLAVSGLHVLMVGMIVYGLLCPILLRFGLRWRAMEIARATTTLTLLIVYAVVTGGSASVTRAVVMAGVFIGGISLQRRAPALNSLAVAGSLLLLQRPTYLWDVGFQLSFAAVGAIVLLQRSLQQVVRDRWPDDCWQSNAADATTTTVAATLGTAPVLLYHFGSVSLAGLLLNPLAIPATGATLSSGLLTVAFSGLPWIAGAFGQSADLFAHLLVQTADLGDRFFGWARIDGRVTQPSYVLAIILGSTALAVAHIPRLRWRALIAATSCILIGVWGGVIGGSIRASLDVLFLDVGQGDAALIRMPNGRHMLVDAGPRDDYFDAGARVLVPHLERFGIDRLDAVVITHPHADHLGGLPSILRQIPVRRVIHNGDDYASALFDETSRLLDSLGIEATSTSAGDSMMLDPRVRIYVLSPTDRTKHDENPNERSVVLLIRYGSTSFLLPGDAEDLAERELLTFYDDVLGVDVVKVAHHGSRTSSLPAFVEAVSSGEGGPLGVISVAERNRFGLPDEDVIERWREAGARLHVTAAEGALWLRSNGRAIRIVPWRSDQ